MNIFINMTTTIKNNSNCVIQIPNASNYRIECVNNTYRLIPKGYVTTIEELKNYSYKYCKILECNIRNKNNLISEEIKTKNILIDIWTSMDKTKMIEHSTFNFSDSNENDKKGYRWNERLQMSFQSKSATDSLHEIYKMVEINNYMIDISIRLENGTIIYYKNNENIVTIV